MKNELKKDNSTMVFAVVLIVVGGIWLLRKAGIFFNFPHIHLGDIFYPFRQIFSHFGGFIFSWPMILILVGLLLLAGKRSFGIVLIVIGGIFILPRLFVVPGLSLSLLFPVFLIGAGVALIARKI